MAEKRILGQDLEVSAVGLGCMGFTHAYGIPANKEESIKAIHEAVDYGYTFFDTAECYVEKNADDVLERNEDLVGEALKPFRNQIKLASKFGVTITEKGLVTDSRPETIRKAIEGSLSRLQTDHLDLYYQHRIDANTPAEEVAGVMADLIKEGKILHWGISETDEEYLRKAHAVCPVTCIQNRLSMMARWHEALFPVLEELNIGQSTLSHHMKTLCDVGIVTGRKEGKWMHYSICCEGVGNLGTALQELLVTGSLPAHCNCKEK